MTAAEPSVVPRGRLPAVDLGHVAQRLLPLVPMLLFGLRLWASVCLALFVAFWLRLDNASWAGATAAIVCQPQLGASLRKGWFRMLGTLVGAVMAVVMTACFPQDRIGFLMSLALGAAPARWSRRCCAILPPMRRRLPATPRRSSPATSLAR